LSEGLDLTERIEAVRVGYAPIQMAEPMRTAYHDVTETHNALVEIRVDGLAGQGVALTLRHRHAEAVCAVAADLGQLLIGEDARDVRGHWRRMLRHLNLTGRAGIGLFALAAIDTALWDVLAQRAGMPFYQLLGGSSVQLPVYAQPGWFWKPVEAVIDEARRYVEQGFRHYKMRIGSQDWRSDVKRVETVRNALPDDVGLLVDANQGWNRRDALAACRALDALELYWIEEPVDSDDLEGCAAITAAIQTPIAAGESMFGSRGMVDLIQARAASILMPDLQHCGGPTGFMQVMTHAEFARLPISNHIFTEVSIHLLATCGDPLIVEHMPGWWDGLFDRPLNIVDGAMRPPEDPGIGYRFSDRAADALTPR
jgi:L-alanine-DL-glutamate epimerase-like enolase superfamily enzyme